MITQIFNSQIPVATIKDSPTLKMIALEFLIINFRFMIRNKQITLSSLNIRGKNENNYKYTGKKIK